MSANRKTHSAPNWVLSLSKTTLADLVWSLAAQHGSCQSCDDPYEVARVMREVAAGENVSKSDMCTIDRWVSAHELLAESDAASKETKSVSLPSNDKTQSKWDEGKFEPSPVEAGYPSWRQS